MNALMWLAVGQAAVFALCLVIVVRLRWLESWRRQVVNIELKAPSGMTIAQAGEKAMRAMINAGRRRVQ